MLRLLMTASLLISTLTACTSGREETLCGAIQERAVFTLWSWHVPERNPDQVTQNPLIETASFTADDDTTLRGYRYLAHNDAGEPVEPQGYVLVAMGNAMVSDHMVQALETLAGAGYHVYVYDYRGYADSAGRRRIGAILADYEDMVREKNTRYDRALLYGTSLGGMVMTNVIGRGAHFDRAVIDASPSVLSDHGCPESIDPVNQLTADTAERMLVITGARDSVLGDDMTGPLRETAAELGAETYHGEQYNHPFMDTPATHRERQQRTFDFLLAR